MRKRIAERVKKRRGRTLGGPLIDVLVLRDRLERKGLDDAIEPFAAKDVYTFLELDAALVELERGLDVIELCSLLRRTAGCDGGANAVLKSPEL